MISEQDAYDQLCGYSLMHGGPEFIHQHFVDAFAAQHATAQTKPIAITFALVGLYLLIEKGFNGRQVQQMHMQMARRKRDWPEFSLAADRGSITAVDVLAAPEGTARDNAIHAWCHAVWTAFSANRETVRRLLMEEGIS